MADVEETTKQTSQRSKAATSSKEQPPSNRYTKGPEPHSEGQLSQEGSSSMRERMLSPFEEMDRMMERMFEGFFPRNWRRALPLRSERPNVDVINRENELLIRAEVPGFDKDDIEVRVTDQQVTISGQCRSSQEENKSDYYRSEISQTSFSRSFSLPTHVDGSKAKATFKNGILELTLPKTDRAPGRTIPIQ